MKMRWRCRKALAFTASFLLLTTCMPAGITAGEVGSADNGDIQTMGESGSVYLPITIRDYAADGMLFEWNELGQYGEKQVDGKTLHHGNTNGYTLYLTNTKDRFDVLKGNTIPKSTAYQNGSYGQSSQPNFRQVKLNSGVDQMLYGGRIRTGLVESVLGEDGKPVYRKEVVDFLADYMKLTLPEVYENEDGSINMWYVMGQELEELGGKELAQILREQIIDERSEEEQLGSYEESKKKQEEGNLSDCFDIQTYYDAAYFFLHDLYRDSTGFGKEIPSYDAIRLDSRTDEDGNTRYMFNSAYTDTAYDQDKGLIYNTQADSFEQIGWAFGNKIPAETFNPIPDQGYGRNSNIYLEMDDIHGYLPFYGNTNYDLTLESHSKFVYHKNSDLFFRFTGDDDVYVFINGILAMDMGGAHPMTKTSINLNDQASRLGLVDGETYDFEFFYMERHGFSANFGIETNIKMLEPSMVTEETAFQDEILVGYGGEVDPQKDVIYQFELCNDGETEIKNLTFTDKKLDVRLTKDKLDLNQFTSMEDLIVSRKLADGSEDLSITSPTEEQLKKILEEGLPVGAKLQIYGFHYRIDKKEWEKESDNREVFRDTLETTSVATGFNIEGGQKDLRGLADYKVSKREYSYEQVHYYDWGSLSDSLTEAEKDPDILVGNDGKYELKEPSEGFTIARADLLKTITDAGVKLTDSDLEEAKITICTNTGETGEGVQINPHVTVDENGDVHYQTDATGRDVFYYQMSYKDKTYGPVAVVTYTYGTSDNVYVIDYDLPVELYDDEKSGFTCNDLLSLASLNPTATDCTLVGIQDSEESFGSFKSGAGTLNYTPTSFMDGAEKACVQVQILERGAEKLTRNTGVVLTQNITVVPANVMHYEDTFPGLTYIAEDGNIWSLYEGFDENGNSTSATHQSIDQDTPYGSDPAYGQDHEENITMNSDASNDKIHELTINQTGDVLRFEFTGTGFDILSRTTSRNYAVLSVEVTEKKSGELVRQIPVITESENGDLTQIPVISVKDLPRKAYVVNVRGAKSNAAREAGIDRTFYVDGVRIYHPLKGEEEVLYYRSDEAESTFYEIKSLIQEGKAAYVSLGSDQKILTGTTLIEDRDEYGFLLKETDSLEEYMKLGPNNELYLNGTSGISLLMLTLKKVESETDSTIQVGAHRKADATFQSNGYVNMIWGSDLDVIAEGTNQIAIETGTENYYRIPEEDLKTEEDGTIFLYVGTSESENDGEVLSLTNLKLSGYEVLKAEQMLKSPVLNQNLLRRFPVREEAENVVPEAGEDTGEEQNKPQETEVEEDRDAQQTDGNAQTQMHLDSVKFKNESVVSGKTATLLAVTDLDASEIHVLDDADQEVALTRSVSREKDGKKIFTLSFKVEGDPGSEKSYTVFATGPDAVDSGRQMIHLQIK